MRMESGEQLGTSGQRNFHLYHKWETYFVLSERRNNVVHNSKSRLGKAAIGSWYTEKRWKVYGMKGQPWKDQ